MENLSTLAAALPAPSPTQFQTLPLEIRYQIYESLINLPCTIIVGSIRSVCAPSTPVKDESRGNLGPLSESCNKLREEIHSWAPVLKTRGIVISKAFGILDPKLTSFRFNWTNSISQPTVYYPAPTVPASVIEIFVLWKSCLMDDENQKTMFRRLKKKRRYEYVDWLMSWVWLRTGGDEGYGRHLFGLTFLTGCLLGYDAPSQGQNWGPDERLTSATCRIIYS
jgi:hypothetical protein